MEVVIDRASDQDLLNEFVATRDADAFAVLVRRYADLVFATAMRIAGDAHAAEDVAQATFVVLAGKARSVDPRTLPGWLVNTARLAAKEATRSKRCRDRHEAGAARMRETTTTTTTRPSDEPTAADLAPLLDDALSRLGEAERAAVVMRFFLGLRYAHIAASMATTEEAARKRVHRAVKRLRAILVRRGAAPSLGGLMLVLTSQRAGAAPAALVESLAATASAGGSAWGAALAKGVVTAMKYAQLKSGATVLAAVTLVGGLSIGVGSLRRANAATAAAPAPSSAPAPAPAPSSAPAPPEAPAAAEAPAPATAPADAPFKAELKNGVSVELLGLIHGKVVSDAWLPDGTPDDGAKIVRVRFERTKVIYPPEAERLPGANVVVRFNLKLRDGTTATASNERWFSTGYDGEDKPIEDVVVVMGMGDRKAKKNDVRFRFATGEWEPTDLRAAADELGGTKKGVRFTKAESLRDGTYVGLIAKEDAWLKAVGGVGVQRLCARDAAGETRVAIPFQPKGEGAPAPTEHGFLFEDVEPADLQAFWLERRSVNEWVEFRDVAWAPGVKTEVKIVTSDNPPEEPGAEGL